MFEYERSLRTFHIRTLTCERKKLKLFARTTRVRSERKGLRKGQEGCFARTQGKSTKLIRKRATRLAGILLENEQFIAKRVLKRKLLEQFIAKAKNCWSNLSRKMYFWKEYFWKCRILLAIYRNRKQFIEILEIFCKSEAKITKSQSKIQNIKKYND